MFRHRLPANYNQISHSLCPTRNSSNRMNSLSIESEAWSPQPLTPTHTSQFHEPLITSSIDLHAGQQPDLFAALLYDREGAYRDGTTSVTSILAEHVNSERVRRPACNRNIFDASYSRPSTLSFNKDQTRVSTIGQQNSSNPLIQEVEHSSEDMVSPKPHPKLQQEVLRERSSRENPSKKDPPRRKGRSSGTKFKKRPAPKQEATKGRVSKKTKTDSKANIGKKIGNRSSLICTRALSQDIIEMLDSDAEAITLEEELNDEGQHVRQQLQAAHDIARRLRQDLEQKNKEALEDEQTAKKKHRQELNFLRSQLHSCHANLAQQMKLVTEHQAIQFQHQEEEKAYKQEQARMLENNLKFKADTEMAQEQIRTLEKKNLELLAEVKTLKAAVNSALDLPATSPVSSTTSFLEEEKREGNVRRMYVKTKRQFDILHSVANDLVACTRSIDVSNFGEFGKYLKRLRSSLEMEGGTNAQQALAVRGSDEYDD